MGKKLTDDMGAVNCAECFFCGSCNSHSVAHVAQLVEHVLGKDEVTSSILVVSSIFFHAFHFRDWPMNANDIRKGMVLLHNNEPHYVMESTHRTPGNLRAFVQARLRNLKTGNSFETRFSSTESVERVNLSRQDMEFLYRDEDLYHFMNTENYEQVALNSESLGDTAKYMQEGIKVQIEFYETDPLSVTLPGSIDLEVVETEPEVKGGTASNSPKPAKLSNGVTVMVPPFIKQGEKVRINPNEDKYIERVK